MSTAKTPFKVVIPARYAASRLPGKPLRELLGRPMVAHVHDRALEAGAEEVLVAADDERIRQAMSDVGAAVVMTRTDHTSGTDRLAEVAQARGWSDDTIVVNLQGDEPCMPGALVADVALALAAHPEAGIATLATPIRTAADVFDPNVVKVVCDRAGLALYFSRAPVPWQRGDFQWGNPPPDRLPEGLFLRHLGLYAYRVGTLRQVSEAAPVATEMAESLEQLRALDLGLRIHVTVVQQAPGHGVDTPEDLERVERELKAREGQP